MSFPELLAAARALPPDEQVRLAHTLLEAARPEYPLTPDEKLLAAMFPTGGVYELFSPPDAGGAAEVLQALLAAGRDEV